ncbi:hypothetical protein Q8A67_001633 [Cirrhinus molitorella]|uniref:Fucolectin tachylectin-4 pentraxin-1 domain-containing protein n=1 Tax=Cirrhinus molitorella TaxID=172907 RepID=A0AA88QIQ1_9TELE|nr:hypothetical protein Q8A67_001633 [Cirrhinus molitorella]
MPVNIATRGIPSQSSLYSSWYARKALDGNNNTCSHTALQTDPWWKVDLLKTYSVNRVTITNRPDCCEQRINGAEIRVGYDSSDVFSNPVCAVVATIPAGATISYSCQGMEGRYVTVNIAGSSKILTLCEVGVYVIFPDNLATGRNVTQSSTYGTWFAGRAIDFSPGSTALWSSCSSTDIQTNPWWRVDLSYIYRVSRVVITNRLDCCPERINGAEIRIGNSLENNGNNNPICAVISSISAGVSSTYLCNDMEGQYVNLVIPGDSKYLTLCEVEVYGEGVLFYKKIFVKMKLKTSSSPSEPVMRVQLLSQLQSAMDSQTETDAEGGCTKCAVIPTIPVGATFSYSCDGMEGRYVFVNIPGTSRILTVCEVGVYVIFPGNLATGKTIAQSSTIGTWLARQAIDLNPGFKQPGSSCSSTNGETNPWWRVDLHYIYRISTVVVTNRLDCCPERINGAEIHVGNSLENNGNNNPICAVISSIPAGASSTYLCNNMEGRYVNLFIPGDSRFLTLCEVEVYGEGPLLKKTFVKMKLKSSSSLSEPERRVQLLSQLESALAERGISDVTLQWTQLSKQEVMRKEAAPGCLSIQEMANGADENVALWRSVSMSSQYMDWRSRYVVDGLYDSCSHTNSETDPWWSVDLLNEYQVEKVAITNRDDIFNYLRINGAVVRVGNFPNNIYSNPICATITTIPPGATDTYSCEMVGRYVIVHIPGDEKTLTLCEVEVYGQLIGNLASNGTVTQSSTSGDWFAEKAIDGNRGLQRLRIGCSSTLTETNPWWRLDLSHVYRISRVVITNRNDCCVEQMNGAEIRIGNSLENNGNDNPLCAVIPAIPGGDSYSYSCGGMDGRYLNLFIPGSKKTITLCEVEVFGEGPILKRSTVKIKLNFRHDLTNPTMRENILEKLGSALADRGFTNVTLSWYQTPQQVIQKVDAPKKNIAINGKAVQSSTLRYEANKAIDNGDLYCTHTETETNPWWRLDLLDIQIIKEVIVTNRIDCCFEQINGAEIRVGNSLENNGNSNPICAEISGIPAGQSVSYSCGEMQGRYVNVVIPGDSKNLTLCEVRVYGNDNVKLSGNAAQSSVFEYWRADRAIDGKKYAPGAASFCTHSKRETNPWWRLDLLDTYYIITVTITNRADCCPARLDGAEIRIGNSLENNGNSNPICAVVTSIPAGASYSYACLDMEGRYVNIVIPGDKILTLCEVEVSRGFPVRHFVKMKFASTSDLTGPEHDKLLFQLQSALGVRGITNVKLSWTKPPQREVERDVEVEEGPCARIQ